jgi:uroporphyrin-III C-methyltransferase / precorrin-2 dehydrogenase / sirohydrochlorin ferrochelatase
MSASRTPSEARTPRMEPLARLPVFFALAGKRAVIAGGSPAAAWKAELLAAAGAKVEVFAAGASEEMGAVAAEPARSESGNVINAVTIHERSWAAGDLAGAAIAVGAFADDQQAGAFAAAARAAGVPVNVIDKPAFCDFSFGSIVNRSPLVIGISTDGAAPVFAQAIRAKLEALIPLGFARWADAARRWRRAVQSSGLSFPARRRFWQVFTAQAVTRPDHEPAGADFEAYMAVTREGSAAAEHGSVTLVGAGPGDPELLTLRAVRALQSADVILIDDLVAPGVLDFARREAKKMLVGKTGYGPSCEQEEINALMIGLARAGKRVVRLKGGDPMIFGRASEEIEACRSAGIAVEVVPGISAAQGAASRLGISLTHRKVSRRVQYVTGHAADGHLPTDIDWQSLADAAATTIVYMPGKTIRELAETAIAHGLAADTPTIAVASATRPEQEVIAGTIADIADRVRDAAPSGPLLVMIGRALADVACGEVEAGGSETTPENPPANGRMQAS